MILSFYSLSTFEFFNSFKPNYFIKKKNPRSLLHKKSDIKVILLYNEINLGHFYFYLNVNSCLTNKKKILTALYLRTKEAEETRKDQTPSPTSASKLCLPQTPSFRGGAAGLYKPNQRSRPSPKGKAFNTHLSFLRKIFLLSQGRKKEVKLQLRRHQSLTLFFGGVS